VISSETERPSSQRIAIITLLAAITIDSVLSNVADFMTPIIPTSVRTIAFSIITIIAIVMGLRICIDQTDRISNSRHLSALLAGTPKVMRAIQFSLSGLLGVILFEEVIFMQYHTLSLLGIMVLSYFTGAGFLGFLSYKFIQWFRIIPKNRRNWVSLFFLISSVLMALILSMTILSQSIILFDRFPVVVTSQSHPQFPSLQSLPEFIQILLAVPYLMTPAWGFLIWTGSALLLRSYSQSIGKPLFWLLIIGSLASIILGSVIVFTPNTNGPFDTSLIGFRLTGIAAIIGQGFLLGFVFLKISKNIEGGQAAKFKESLRTTAIGISILYAAVSANLAFGALPPLGAVSYAFVALGASLFVSGIYSSAVFSADIGIRKMIRNYLDKSGFIDTIGRANRDIELTNTVISISKKYVKSLENRTGFDLTMSDTEYRQYLDEVLEEAQKVDRYNNASEE